MTLELERNAFTGVGPVKQRLAFTGRLVAGLMATMMVAAQAQEGWSDIFNTPEAWGSVYSVAETTDAVIVGGLFNRIGPLTTNSIARYDKAAGTWSGISSGLNNGNGLGLGGVGRMLVSGNQVYVVHSTGVENSPNVRVSRWDDGAQTWTILGGEFNATVRGLTLNGTDLYAVGDFTEVGGVTANKIAKCNTGTGAWTSITGSVNGTLRAAAAVSGQVYVAGEFTEANHLNGGSPETITANRVAKWNPSTEMWTALGAGVVNNTPGIIQLAVVGTNLYVGGGLTSAGGSAVNAIARWDTVGETWSALGSGVTAVEFQPHVSTFAVSGNFLYMVGYFHTAGGLPAVGVARFDTSDNTWSSLAGGVSGEVQGLSASATSVYVAGPEGVYPGEAVGFPQVFTGKLARWDVVNSTWHPVLTGEGTGKVHALLDAGDSIYAGVTSTYAGSDMVNSVARWDKAAQNWVAMGAGVGPVPSEVKAFALGNNGDVFVGGTFTSATDADGTTRTVNGIARWNRTTGRWSALGSGVRSFGGLDIGTVHALFFDGTNLYVGGSFDRAGGVEVGHFARWSESTQTWTTDIAGMQYPGLGKVRAMTMVQGELFVGGDNGLRRWRSEFNTWGLVGPDTNTDGAVHVMATTGKDLWVGGAFTQVRELGVNTAMNRIARWDTLAQQWNAIGLGANDIVRAMHLRGSHLTLGGDFTEVTDGTGAVTVSCVARFSLATGTAHALAGGVDGFVSAVTDDGTQVHVGGESSHAGGKPSSGMAAYTLASVADLLVEHPAGLPWRPWSSPVDFGAVTGGGATTEDLVITNAGSAAMTVSTALTGTHAADYSIFTAPAGTVQPGQSTSITVRFQPSVNGTRVAVLRLTTNDSTQNPLDVPLTGSGPAPEIVVEEPADNALTDGSATPVAFGNVVPNSGAQKTFTIRNTGTAPLTGLALSLAGSHPGDFSLGTLGTTSLNAGTSTTFTVSCSPTTLGSLREAILRIASDDENENPFDVNLTATGVTPVIVVERPAGTRLTSGVSTVSFGDSPVGAPVTLEFTIGNDDPATAALTGLVLEAGGTNPGDITLGTLETTVLSSGSTTTVNVTFTPQDLGARSATLRIFSNDPDAGENPFIVTLTANGTPPLIPDITVEQPFNTPLTSGSSTVDFGAVPSGDSADLQFMIRSSGNTDLTGIAVTVTGANASEVTVGNLGFTSIQPSGSNSFNVSFRPGGPGLRTAVLRITSSDPDENPFLVTLNAHVTNPGVIALGSAFISVDEDAGIVEIPIVRTGGNDGDVSVKVTTANGAAVAGSDYTAVVNDTVTFDSGGATSIAYPVTILNGGGAAELNETFTVTISQATDGATLGTLKTATVQILDTTDTTVPGIPVITAPAASAQLGVATGGTITVTGTAADNQRVETVEVSLDGINFTQATVTLTGTGAAYGKTATFTATITPVTDSNTVVARTMDRRGNNSFNSAPRSFKVLRPLTVNVNTTLGSVTTGFAPSSFREVGKSFTMTAAAKPPTTTPVFAGAIFTGWTLGGQDVARGNIAFTPQRIGAATSALEKHTITFVFREGLVLTPGFTNNTFAPLVGTYNGLIRASATLPDRAPFGVNNGEDGTAPSISTEGGFTATVTNTGAFSGKLTIDGLVLNVAGAFDHNGTARFGTARALTLTVARTGKPSLVVAFQIDLVTPGTNDKITGTVTATDFMRSLTMGVSTVDGDRAFYNGTTRIVPVAYLGAANANGFFTTVLPAKPPFNVLDPVNTQTEGFTTQDYPQGDGIGTITVTKAGVITVAATLADGTAATATSALSEANTFPLFVRLYNKLGFLSGMITLNSAATTSDMAGGNLLWLRPTLTTSHYYPYGWPEVIKVDLAAAKYLVTAGQSVLRAPDGTDGGNEGDSLKAADMDGNATLTFSDGLLSESLMKSVNISPTDSVIKVPDNDPTYTLVITRATGAISGSISHTDDTVPAFKGMIYQKGPNAGAYGFFLTKQPVPIDYTGQSGGVTLIGEP